MTSPPIEPPPVPIVDQPPPVPSDRPAIWPLVISDMQERDVVGRQRYGTPLQAHNGRDALVDAYQEALDLAVYMRQRIEEDRDRPALLAELEAQREKAGRCEVSEHVAWRKYREVKAEVREEFRAREAALVAALTDAASLAESAIIPAPDRAKRWRALTNPAPAGALETE